MERITFEGNFCDISRCRENPCPYNGMCSQRQTWERLKEYENTGLEPENLKKAFDESAILKLAAQALSTTPDHLRELVKAEQDGRLVVLPCKVGAPIYTTHWWKDVKEKCTDSNGKPFYRMVSKNIIKKERFDPFGPDYKWLGKTVFLTREEAEEALKGGAG